MSIRGDITIDWSASPRIIEVAAPSVMLTIQDLYDTLRSLGVEAIDEPEIIDGSGKEVLSATELVGLTVKLLNAKVKFEDRASPTDCNISGGNLVALDGNGAPMNPIQYAPYVTVTYAKSSSATLVQAAEILAIKVKTDNLPTDPTSKFNLEAAHGLGSWEGATPTQVWNHDDRRLTSRDIESQVPGEYLPSEEQVQDVQTVLDLIKGLGFDSGEDALRVIRQLIQAAGRRGASFKV